METNFANEEDSIYSCHINASIILEQFALTCPKANENYTYLPSNLKLTGLPFNCLKLHT